MTRVLDLFHGAGGSSLGAQAAGAQIAAGIDFWPAATDAYSRNVRPEFTFSADIRELDPRRIHDQIGDIDLMLASPECTSHSCARGARAKSEESRLTAFQVVRFAAEFHPQWVIVENVVQMRSWGRQEELVKSLIDLGYSVSEERLNARDFGVPQSRKRLYLVCAHQQSVPQVLVPQWPTMPAWGVVDFGAAYRFTPLRTPRRAQATIERAERAIRALGPSVPFVLVYYGTDGSGGWQPLDRPLRTVTTIDRFALVVPSEDGHNMRMLQPEELKVAMGFPSWYDLGTCSRREKIRLLGNAVCPPVMQSLVSQLCGIPGPESPSEVESAPHGSWMASSGFAPRPSTRGEGAAIRCSAGT